MSLECDGASAYVNSLLRELGAAPLPRAVREPHPALRWAQSGAMALTGDSGGPPEMCPVPLAAYADGIVAALAWLAGPRRGAALARLDGARLLGERAALAGHGRRGAIAPGGSCRLLRAADGWLAVSLPRDSDWELLPAWLEAGGIADWAGIARTLAVRSGPDCLARGRLLGLALAPLEADEAPPPWCVRLYRSAPVPRAPRHAPLVIDLSALWAGPLCAQLLALMGARVVKVESTQRPDGLRLAGSAFYHLLNAGKASVALDFAQPAARGRLRQLLRHADIVIEAARPRALRQLGICAEQILDETPGLTWVAISGHGREEPGANWVSFGDDAAVAAGLSQVMRDCSGRPLICADAVADPLTGLHAALAAWTSHLQGGGGLLSLALSGVVARAIRHAALADGAAARERAAAWRREVGNAAVAAPGARPVRACARPLGADTLEVLSSLGARRSAAQRLVCAARRPASRPKNVASASESPEL
jgi:crotonobetainyl-CoA:carnitine CoA-transferase CaiB-like acyl-CoA transferase